MPSTDTPIAGLDVLVVEDEAIVAINLESMLEELGCSILGPIMQLDKAIQAVGKGMTPAVAILDVNLNGQRVFPLARLLTAQGTPIVFATGYGREGLPADWQDFPVIQKPYTLQQVADAVVLAVNGGQSDIGASPA